LLGDKEARRLRCICELSEKRCRRQVNAVSQDSVAMRYMGAKHVETRVSQRAIFGIGFCFPLPSLAEVRDC
jgi:hypothetical protein